MADRGSFRGGRGGRGGGRGARGGGGGAASGQAAERPKKENILDLSKYMDKTVNVKFNGGREGMSPSFPSLLPPPLASLICIAV